MAGVEALELISQRPDARIVPGVFAHRLHIRGSPAAGVVVGRLIRAFRQAMISPPLAVPEVTVGEAEVLVPSRRPSRPCLPVRTW